MLHKSVEGQTQVVVGRLFRFIQNKRVHCNWLHTNNKAILTWPSTLQLQHPL